VYPKEPIKIKSGIVVIMKDDLIPKVNINFEKQKKEFVDRLLRWYSVHKREFSWRKRELTPYQVLILELMLQRTQAQKVEEVFENFIKKFKDPISLYLSQDSEIESTLRTLGLQKRRRELLKNLAEHLVKKHDGQVPVKLDELLQVPGVGIYVANAILCYCYGKTVPLIDTNAARVLGRIFGLPSRGDPSSEKHFWTFAEHILPKDYSKSFNWALIDFGSLVCRPKNPRCSRCPMCDICTRFLESRNKIRDDITISRHMTTKESTKHKNLS
jgi:A/G-specific adenine glycosylase